MADQHKSDTVMKFIMKDAGPVSAECALGKDPDDDYMTDFTPQTYANYSDFFEIHKFSMEFEVKDQDKTKSRTGTQAGKQGTDAINKVSKVAGEFASWRSATQNQTPDMLFPLEFDTFSFERLIDAASPVFFKHCVDSKSFEKAILVKRLSIGGDKPPSGFLRVEFKNVLITRLDWDDGDMTTEKCEFICRDMTLLYRQQRPDGGWDAPGNAHWNSKEHALKGTSSGTP